MKWLRTVLLGSAAGLITLGAAHAGDVQGKMKPLAHSKNCSAYGAGFRRVPGSDLCMKIGGWVQTETTAHGNGNINWNALNANEGASSTVTAPARGYLTTDVRGQTSFGPVRGYMSVGVNHQ